MRKLYRKLLLLLPALALLLPANASNIVIDYQGYTNVTQQTVEQNLLITNDDDGVYNIAIKPLDTELRSTDGKTTIPLRYVFINNNREDVYLRYNEYSILFERLNVPNVPQNIMAKIRDYGMVPAGIYTMAFEIQATDSDNGQITGTSMFNLRFVVPSKQEITIHGDAPVINIGASTVGNKQPRVVNQTSPMLYINSNTDWILTLKTDGYDNSQGDFYVRTVGASGNVMERLQERVLIQQGHDIILAKGKGPSNNEYVTVEYSVDNDPKNMKRAGTYLNKIRYVLKENRG